MPHVVLERENACRRQTTRSPGCGGIFNSLGPSRTLACGTGAEQILDVCSRDY